MLKEAIYHRPQNNYAYAYNEDTLHIRIRTKKDNVHSVTLISGDPYDWTKDKWNAVETPMSYEATDDLFDYWLVEIKPPYKRLRYGFELKDKSETLFYGEEGFFAKPPLTEIDAFFCFPFLNHIDVFDAPKWVKDTVWYQIFPERFANGNLENDPETALEWDSAPPSPNNFFGGDFEGIIEHLDYLVDLGITGIYLTPIFKANTNHKYDTVDYMEIDPQFGDKETFKKLIKLCHANGIKVMLDAVFNHSGYYFPPFQDVVKKGEKSTYKDWFHIRGFPIDTKGVPNFDTFAFTPQMPKLNTENTEVKAYLLDVARYWIEEFDIDGWRLDVANEVDHHFWREFRQVVKAIKPEAYILGEIWHDSIPWLQGDQFDAVMNYPFTNSVLDFFATQKINASTFTEKINRNLVMYSAHVNEVAFNLLGSHDTPRVLTLAEGHVERAKLMYLFQLTFLGSPCIYYGDEIGLEGDNDPGCRACMPWDEAKEDEDLFHYIKSLIHLRHSDRAFANEANFRFVDADDKTNTIVYERVSATKHYTFAINNSKKAAQLKLDLDKNTTELVLTKKGFEAENELIDADLIKLEPFGFRIFQS